MISEGANNSIVRNNIINLSTNGISAVAKNTSIENNLIYNSSHHCIDLHPQWSLDGNVGFIDIVNNSCFDTSDNEIYMLNITNVSIKNNTFQRGMGTGILMSDEYGFSYVNITNNTFNLSESSVGYCLRNNLVGETINQKINIKENNFINCNQNICLLYTSPSPRDRS